MSDYKNPSQIAHRVLADRIGQRDPGNTKPKPGDRIKYVFIDSSTNSPKSLLVSGERIESNAGISISSKLLLFQKELHGNS